MNLYLPYVLEYNKDVNGDKIAELLLPLAGADVYAATPAAQRAQKSIDVIRAMRDELFNRTKLPRTLKETGKVQESQLKEIAEKALDDGSIIYNPKEARMDDLMAVLKKAFG
jgi:alcohol dehydrogenase